MKLSRGAAVAAALSAIAIASAYTLNVQPSRGGSRRLAALDQTVVPSSPRVALRLPSLTTAGGEAFGAERLRGRWSLVFFGYTTCPDVCPRTLTAFSEIARQPASGVSDGVTQLLFVSIQPEGDTPARVKSYLAHFHPAIVGLTGDRDAVTRFSREVGASADSSKLGVDHSTSLFVIDPEGKLAGVLLRPSDAARVIDGLNTLRASAPNGD